MSHVLALMCMLGEQVLIPASPNQSAFHIDRTEVTIKAFREFEAAGGYQNTDFWSKSGQEWLKKNPDGAGADRRSSNRDERHPVVAVSYFEAEAFCAWKGGRLPSGEEWTQAICSSQPYPWGASQDAPARWFKEGKHGKIATVNTHPAEQEDSSLKGPFSVIHGAGNVWEWTTATIGPNKTWRTLRGGSYANLPSYCRCDHYEAALPSDTRLTTGFRCAYP